MLWIALHLPLLSLESFAATLAAGECHGAIALTDTHRIASANAVAEALGVKSGLKRATALALAPDIVLGQADALRDGQAILAVAHAALAYTPTVVLDAPDEPAAAPHTVLLEVQASLRCFGGLRALLRRLHATLQPLGHRVHCATAPTAQGAALLARLPDAPDGRHAGDLPTLERLLDAAPVWLLGPGREHWEALQGMGLRSIGDLRGLPRSGLARRFGASLLDALDRARGVRADPRPCVRLPDTYASRLELHARADTTEQVLHGAAILLARLVAWAGAQHAQVCRYTLRMKHEPRHRPDAATPADTTLEIALADPSRDATHLLVLLRERLARLELPAPTLEIVIDCSDIVRGAPPNGELFPTAKSEREGLTRLIERLQARLGHERVQRLHRVEDHRPECATAARPAEAVLRTAQPAAAPVAGPTRPLWLLADPEPLGERQMRPLLDGRALQLLCGPERIESGWWDAALAERDYFIAQADDGALVWIYRARLPSALAQEGSGWFLQGRFG